MGARFALPLPVEVAPVKPDATSLLAGYRASVQQRLASRERRVEAALAVAFAAAVAVLALLFDGREVPAGHAIPLVIAYACAARVRFPVGAGYTAPTQLVFVGMLVLLPAASVPLLVCAALVLSRLPDYVARHSAERVLLVPGDAWHAVGPALVLGLAGDQALGWQDWPVLAAAVAAQLATDAGVSMVRLRLVAREPLRLHLEAMSWLYVVDVLLTPFGFLVAMAAAERPWAALLVLPFLGVMQLFAHERQTRIDHAIELDQAYRGTTTLLGDVLEHDHGYTGGHSREVVALSLEVAARLGLDLRRRRLVEFGALLHDLGKIAVPKEILDKPAPLTEEEWLVVRRHTVDGQRMLERVGGLLTDVGRVVRWSHERWDGRGYPDGLRGEEIPLESAIVCCCDAYHAMTSDRPYRRALPDRVAIQEVCENAGRQFAPEVADAVAAVVEARGPVDRASRLDARLAPREEGVGDAAA
jgi:HD-GYP domain-containing protein (c-di-GMP phosphodiesterase class II)